MKIMVFLWLPSDFFLIIKLFSEQFFIFFLQNSMAGCACSYAHCSPDKCDHVSLFDRAYENLVDIYGTPMRGRFAYDENGKIILQVIISIGDFF